MENPETGSKPVKTPAETTATNDELCKKTKIQPNGTNGVSDCQHGNGFGASRPESSEPTEVSEEPAEKSVENIPRSNADREHLLTVFSEKIWEVLLEEIEETDQTLENISNASLFFRNLLLPRRQYFLFSNVWQTLRTHFEEENAVFVGTNFYYEEAETALEWPREKLDTLCDDCILRTKNPARLFPNILLFRQVCKTWSHAIDTFLQRPPRKLFPSKQDRQQHRMDMQYCRYYHINSLGYYVANFFAPTHGEDEFTRCPMITNSLKMDLIGPIEDNLDTEDIWDNTERLLVKFGKFIRHFAANFSFMTDDSHEIEVYTNLKTLMDLMPNLKMLRIKNTTMQTYQTSTHLRNVMEIGPLPTLKNMNYLSITHLPPIILYKLLSNNSHISKLEMDTRHPDIYYIYRLTLDSLKELKIAFESEEKLHTMVTYKPNWRITKLDMCFSPGGKTGAIQPVDWFGLFRALNSMWSETLTHLRIILPQPRKYQIKLKDAVPPTLNLEHLKSLELTLFAYSSLDFILPTKDTLKNLEIRVQGDCKAETEDEGSEYDGDDEDSGRYNKEDAANTSTGEKEKKKTIQFFSKLTNPSESNLWAIFPLLNRIQYSQDSNRSINWEYYRRDWIKETVNKLKEYKKST